MTIVLLLIARIKREEKIRSEMLQNRSLIRIISLMLIVFIALLFSGCYDRKEVDEMAYVIAIGLDRKD